MLLVVSREILKRLLEVPIGKGFSQAIIFR